MKGNKGVRNRDWRESWFFQVTGSFMVNIPKSKNRRTICGLPPEAGAWISPRTSSGRLVAVLTALASPGDLIRQWPGAKAEILPQTESPW
jgi:hypothetical protein